MSVPNPFVVLLVGIVVLPALLIGLLSWRDREARIAVALADSHQKALAFAEHAGKVFESNLVVLEMLNGQLSELSWDRVRADGQRVHQLMSQAGGGLDQTNVFLLIDAEGRTVVETSRPYGSPPVDVTHREYFRAHAAGDGPFVFVGPVIRGITTNATVFHVSRPRTTAEGRRDGVLVASLFPAYFETVWSALAPKPGDNVALFREDGTLLAHRSADPRYEARAAANQDRIRARLSAQDGTVRADSAVDGRDRALAQRRVGSLPVFVVYGLDLEPVLLGWRATWSAVAIASLLGVTLLAAMTLVAMRRSREEATARAALTETAARLTEEIARREVSEAAALRTGKLEALGQLTGGVAHDINNFLTAIGGNLRLMADDVGPRSRGRLAAAIAGVESATSVTRRLVAFSRREAVNVEPVDLGGTILRIRPLLDRAIRADIRLVIDLSPGRTVCEIDPGQFEACLLNLATNARDAMPGAGRLSLRTSEVILSGRADGLEGPFVVLEVEDTGDGMTADVAARAFDPFFTTKEVGEGTGLGLSTVYAFARQSRGTAEIETAVGRGTVVRILLPSSGRDVAPPPPPLEPPEPQPGPPARVLVVEDSVLVRMVTEDTLTGAGFEVVGAGDGVEAGRILAAHGPFDIMVTDVVMPRGVSGVDLARDAVRRRPGMKVLLVSGYSREHLSEAAQEFALMAKPFTPEDLVRRVRAVLAGRTAEAVRVGDRP
jgi:two-component system, NtrC family, sensor kinase